jgi:hypothetical protein
MRQPTAILFLVLHFLTATELHQLVRIPALLVHYKEHKADETSLNFFQYLSLHYGQAIETDDAKHEHSHLPFQGTCELSLHALWISFPDTVEIFTTHFPANKNTPSVLPVTFLPTNTGTSIWQPPKL